MPRLPHHYTATILPLALLLPSMLYRIYMLKAFPQTGISKYSPIPSIIVPPRISPYHPAPLRILYHSGSFCPVVLRLLPASNTARTTTGLTPVISPPSVGLCDKKHPIWVLVINSICSIYRLVLTSLTCKTFIS